jgi:hypothetical protein
MKMFYEFGWAAIGRSTESAMWLALVLAISAGCGKSNAVAPSAAPPVVSSATSTSTTTPQQTAGNPQPDAGTNGIPKAELQAMNRALLGWMMQNKRHPKTFEDFASSTDFQIPTPPPGQKYALNQRGFIVLVSNASN